jgi:hypothetical protein
MFAEGVIECFYTEQLNGLDQIGLLRPAHTFQDANYLKKLALTFFGGRLSCTS